VVGKVGLPEVGVKAISGGEVENLFGNIKDAATGVIDIEVALVYTFHHKRKVFENGIMAWGGV
jgi:hypothetical protein